MRRPTPRRLVSDSDEVTGACTAPSGVWAQEGTDEVVTSTAPTAKIPPSERTARSANASDTETVDCRRLPPGPEDPRIQRR